MNYCWNRALIGLSLAGLLSGCVPESKDGGSLADTEGNVQPSGNSDASSQTNASAEGSESGTGGVVPAACIEHGWDESYETWQSAVDDAEGEYFYVARTATYLNLGEFHCSYDTMVRVSNGVVVERSFSVSSSAEGADCEEPFTEVGDQIGESDVPLAAAPVGLDEIYVDCCNNHLDLPTDEFLVQFEVDDAGLLEHCSAQSIGCGEGCEVQESGLITIVQHGFRL